MKHFLRIYWTHLVSLIVIGAIMYGLIAFFPTIWAWVRVPVSDITWLHLWVLGIMIAPLLKYK